MYIHAWLGRVGELVLMASDCMSLILWDLTNAFVIRRKKNKRIHCDREKISFCKCVNRINVISQRFSPYTTTKRTIQVVYKLATSYRYHVLLYIEIKKNLSNTEVCIYISILYTIYHKHNTSTTCCLNFVYTIK